MIWTDKSNESCFAGYRGEDEIERIKPEAFYLMHQRYIAGIDADRSGFIMLCLLTNRQNIIGGGGRI